MPTVNSLNLAEVNAALGEYARKFTPDFYTTIMEEVASDVFVRMGGIIDKLPLPILRRGTLLRPYKTGGKITATDDAVKMGVRILEVQRGAWKTSFVPLDYYKTYVGQLMVEKPGGPMDIPFEQFILEEIRKALVEDFELATWRGQYSVTGTQLLDTVDGLLTIIEKAIDDEDVPTENIAVTGVITSSNALEKFELIKSKVPDKYRQAPLRILCGYDVWDAYCSDYQATKGPLQYNQEFEKGRLEGTNWGFRPVAQMSDTNKVFVAPADNFVLGEADPNELSQINTQTEDYVIELFGTHAFGTQVRDTTQLWTNVEA